jgi:hypothetical protein
MRIWLKVLIAGVIVYGGTVGALFHIMHTPETFGKVMRHVPWPAMMLVPFKQLWFAARAGTLKVGDPAPDFDLSTADRKSRVQLSSFRGQKPVVLVFGSYT